MRKKKASAETEIPRGIPSRAICAGFEMSPTTMSYWVAKKLIEPSIQQGTGAKPSLWSLSDLIDIKLLLALREAGVPLHYAAGFVEVVSRDNIYFQIKSIATNGKTIWANTTNSEIVMHPADDLVYLDWEGILNECTELFELASSGNDDASSRN